MIKFESGNPSGNSETSVTTDVSPGSPVSVTSTSYADTGLQHTFETTVADESVEFSLSGYVFEVSHSPHTLHFALKVDSDTDVEVFGNTVSGDYIGPVNFSKSIKFPIPGSHTVKLRSRSREVGGDFTLPVLCVFQMKQ